MNKKANIPLAILGIVVIISLGSMIFINSTIVGEVHKVRSPRSFNPSWSCADSDGGFVIETKGRTNLVDISGYKMENSDTCGPDDRLTEYFCGPQHRILNEMVACPGKCVSGACV